MLMRSDTNVSIHSIFYEEKSNSEQNTGFTLIASPKTPLVVKQELKKR